MPEENEGGLAPEVKPRACAVCERLCPVAVLADLDVAEVCEFCKPLVVELVRTGRQGDSLSDETVKRAMKVAREVERVCVRVERARPTERT